MTKRLHTFVFLVLLAAFGTAAASAAPIQLTSAAFLTQTLGLPTIVEDFESFALGLQTNPLLIANGTFTAPSATAPRIITTSTSVPWCGSSGTQCVITQSLTAAPRTFSTLPAGTTHWSSNLSFILGTDLIQMTVVGGSGTSMFTASAASLAGFAGFADPAGLVSVTFLNLGTAGGVSTFGNYSFDNVTTAAVGEPSSLLLVSGGIAALVAVRRRRRVVTVKP